MRYFITVIIAIVVLTVSGTVVKAVEIESIGFVAAVRGQVYALDASAESRRLKVRNDVFIEDTIITGKQCRIQIVFNDNTVYSLGRNSEMKIANYVWDRDKAEGAMKTEIKEGVFRVVGGAITKRSPRRFKTETPMATIGIRGSMFAGVVDKKSLSVVFQGGAGIEVTSPDGVMVAINRPGFGTNVEIGKAPDRPIRFSAEQQAAIDSGFDVGGAEEFGDNSLDTKKRDRKQEEDGADRAERKEGKGPDRPPEGEIHDWGPEWPEPDRPPDPDVSIEPPEIVKDLQDEFSNELPLDEPQPDEPPPVPDAIVLDMTSGESRGVVNDSDTDSYANDAKWLVTAATAATPVKSVDGMIDEVIDASDGTKFSFSFTIPVYDPNATYAGNTEGSGELIVDPLLGSARNFPLKTMYEDRGEFAVFWVEHATFPKDGQTFNYYHLGYVGDPSTEVPTEGITEYFGGLAGYMDKSSGIEGLSSGLEMEVNWMNKKIIGIINKSENNVHKIGDVYFFGDLTSTGLNTSVCRFVGTGLDDTSGSVYAWEGKIDLGRFYGGEYQGFGGNSSGEIYNIAGNQSARDGEWQFTSGAFREIETDSSIDLYSPTGTETWEGYVMGIAEDMGNPRENRRLYLNDDYTKVWFTIDRENGTVTGSISATDIIDTANTIDQLAVGQSGNSAYVLDDRLIALLGYSVNNPVHSGAHSSDLKPYGNYMAADPDHKFSEDCRAQWGYWEISYSDPEPPGTKQYHLHRPGSMWVAGARTPEAQVDQLISTKFIGTFVGGAEGVKIDSAGEITRLTNGITDLTINFDPSANSPVTGSLAFDQKTLWVDSVSNVSRNGFSADIQGATGRGITGTYYGKHSVESIGG
ncbi:MAG: FecR domain-containing protein, partial [Desulfobulbaceae bacterium]|nr:FecR domain-containing protein [Desulfobulbaceae bacterium]